MTGIWLDGTNRLWRADTSSIVGLGRTQQVNKSSCDWKHKRVKKEALDWLLHDNEDFPMVCVYATVPEVAVRNWQKN